MTVFYHYISIVLGFFPATAPYAGQLAHYALAPFRRVTIAIALDMIAYFKRRRWAKSSGSPLSERLF